MRHALCGALGGLVVGIVAGALPLHASGRLPEPQLKALKAQEPQRASLALAQARTFAPQLGLQPGESLALRNVFTNAEGRTVVRFNQTYAGYRVYGTHSLGHVEADGQVKVLSTGLRPAAIPDGSPRLTADQAQAIALKHAALKGQPLPPKVEQVVFPTAFVDGIRVVFDAVAKNIKIDRDSTVVSRPTKPYVWAYQVDVFTKNRQDGITDMQYIVDAETGALLRKISNLRHQAAPQGPIGTPAKGVGMGQYVGQVAIDTTLQADGTFALVDQTRGSKPNPYFLKYEGLNLTGITTLSEVHPLSMEWGSAAFFAENPTNAWGDGFPFQDYPNELLKNGETAAVDAHFGIGLTWDLYKNIFGRDGIDGEGTTPFLLVHARNQGTGMKWDNAMFSPSLFGMIFGDGTYLPDVQMGDPETGLPFPGNPYGMMSLTELDVAGHELSHGLTSGTADLIYRGESGGLNESMSDIMGTMVEAYNYRTQDDAIPNFGNDWKLGEKCRPSGPLRYMDIPSKDGLSADNWYEGLDWMEVHYNSGPMNRCFYYLAAGAPASTAAEHHSPYLPGGMDGIGNDHATRIVYKALSEYMVPTTNYHQAGAALVKAAEDLYGANSSELIATKKALTAINVQVAGESLFTRVSFPSNTGGVLSNYPGAEFLTKTLVVPLGSIVPLKATVTNNTDPSVTWKIGGHRAMIGAPGEADPTGLGVINADNTWTAPLRSGFMLLTAASKAKPEQYTEGLVFVQDLDADSDGDQDAVDMGATAFSWFLSQTLRPSHSPYGASWVDDLDVDLFQTAIKNAWVAK